MTMKVGAVLPTLATRRYRIGFLRAFAASYYPAPDCRKHSQSKASAVAIVSTTEKASKNALDEIVGMLRIAHQTEYA